MQVSNVRRRLLIVACCLARATGFHVCQLPVVNGDHSKSNF